VPTPVQYWTMSAGAAAPGRNPRGFTDGKAASDLLSPPGPVRGSPDLPGARDDHYDWTQPQPWEGVFSGRRAPR
jgi:hypothetical protein